MMIRILLCCGGGFSSSAIAQKLSKEIREKELTNQFQIQFYPFIMAPEIWNDFDIILCCPHLRIEIQKLLKEKTPPIPLYILPPRMYGVMNLEEILFDVEDILEYYKLHPTQPVHFPGEENILRVTRNVAYRNTKKRA